MLKIIKRTRTLAIGLLFFVNGIVFASWATNIPFAQSTYHLNEGQIGGILLVMAAGAVVFMSITGYMIRTLGSRTTSMVSTLMFPLALVLVFSAQNFPAFILGVVLLGAANGSMDVVMNQQAAAYEKELGKPVMSTLHGCFSIGALMGSLATFITIAFGGSPLQQSLFVLCAIVILAIVLFPHLIPDETKSQRHSSHPSLKSLNNRKLWVFGTLSFLTMLSEGAIADWSAIYLIDYSDANADTAALGFGFYALLMIVGRFTGDRLSGWCGHRILVILSGSLIALGTAIVLGTSSLYVQFLGFGLLGFGVANLIPIIFSNSAKLKTVQPSLGIAFVSVCGYSGFLIGPAVIGGLATVIGLDSALLIIIIAGLAAIVTGSVFPSLSVPKTHTAICK